VFLSGGIDSTALLALAVQAGRTDVCALTMALPGTDGDERRLAERTARHFGVRHEVCAIDAHAGRTLFEETLRTLDQPSIDGMNTLAVSQLARASGIKVVMSGLGADELFGGYPAVRGIPRLYAWHRRFSRPAILRRAAAATLATLPDSRCRRIGDMLAQPPGLAASYSAYRGIFTRSEAQWLTREFLGSAPGIDEPSEPVHDDDPTLLDATCRLELTRYMRNQLLRDTDVMGMACGVEIRVPYLDSVVVDTVTGIDQGQRLRRDKQLLRAAVPELPDWIARQPKRGFMFPIDAWLQGPWSGVLDAGAARGIAAAGPWYRQACIRAFSEFHGRVRDAGARPESPSLPVTIEVGS
jgi:asparagine synthase (glutamine-hydrolysing)